MDKVYLLIGGNLGERVENLSVATDHISKKAGQIKKISDLYETAAWGISEQPSFLNQAIEIDTNLDPHQLLKAILNIESDMGRIRQQKNGPRLIDIDILFYGDVIIDDPVLSLPHPLLHERRFALVPLNEIASCFIHPLLNKSIDQLLSECRDTLGAARFTFNTH